MPEYRPSSFDEFGEHVDIPVESVMDPSNGEFVGLMAEGHLFALDEVSLDNIMSSSGYSRERTITSYDPSKSSCLIYRSYMGSNPVMLDVVPAKMIYSHPVGGHENMGKGHLIRDSIEIDGCIRVTSVEEVPANAPTVNMKPSEFFGAIDYFKQNMMANLSCKMYEKLEDWLKRKQNYMRN